MLKTCSKRCPENAATCGNGRSTCGGWNEITRPFWILHRRSPDQKTGGVAPALLAASAYRLMGEPELAHASYDSARSILEKELDAHPDDNHIHTDLGFAYAGLGRKEDALREGRLGVELLPVIKDAWAGPSRIEDLARIYVMVGEFDAAIDQLEFLLDRPGWISIPLLRLDPTWDPLRNHPRFKKLVEAGK